MSEDIFVTITGFAVYYGIRIFKVGKVVRLSKERDNNYDNEAIFAELPYFGKIGYVSNNIKTKAKGTVSSGYIYNMFENCCYAKIAFITNTKVIAKIIMSDADGKTLPDLNDIS